MNTPTYTSRVTGRRPWYAIVIEAMQPYVDKDVDYLVLRHAIESHPDTARCTRGRNRVQLMHDVIERLRRAGLMWVTHDDSWHLSSELGE